MVTRIDNITESIVSILHGVREHLDDRHIKVDADKKDKLRVQLLLHAKISDRLKGL
jgi:hypothetical protein